MTRVRLVSPDTIMQGPAGLAEIVGQVDVVGRVKSFLGLYKAHGKTPGHVLIAGGSGMGKGTLARAIAAELGVTITQCESGAISRSGDLMGVLTNLRPEQVLLFDDLAHLHPDIQPYLQCALETFSVDFVVDSLKTITVPLQPFTCVATSSSEQSCRSDLINLFDLKIQLSPYSNHELQLISQALARRRGVEISQAFAELLSDNSDGTPRDLESLVQRFCRLYNVAQEGAGGPPPEGDLRLILDSLGLRPTRGEAAQADFQGVSNLSGVEFEGLISRVLRQMGFRCELTKATGDGGVDIIATLDRPLVGGRYLIQCKRFAPGTAVGASTVREFYGALNADQGALKGILVTTSTFTAQAREFASRVRLELIDGEQLRALVSGSAGKSETDEGSTA